MTGRVRGAARLSALLLVLAAMFLFGFLAGRVGRSGAPGSVLDQAADHIESDAATPVDRADLEQAAIEGMLGTLGDRYAAYYGSADYAEFQKLIDGRYTGIGVWLARVNGRVEVTSVLPGSPAAQAGLRIGDEVVTVDGRRLGGASVTNVVSRMRGEVGTRVELALRRAGTVRPVTLRRGELAASDVLVDRPARGVVRIRVAAFTRGVGREVRTAVAAAHEDRAGVILDLRGNPGGLLVEGVEVASAFLSDGVVVSYRRRGAPEEVHRVASTGDTTASLVVLVDGGTASAAEVVAAALQDRERGVLVGSRTYGKGSVQQPVRLADGTALEFTIARYYTPDGRSLEGVGVRPDIDVESSATDDVAIRRAVEVLDGILADLGTPRG